MNFLFFIIVLRALEDTPLCWPSARVRARESGIARQHTAYWWHRHDQYCVKHNALNRAGLEHVETKKGMRKIRFRLCGFLSAAVFETHNEVTNIQPQIHSRQDECCCCILLSIACGLMVCVFGKCKLNNNGAWQAPRSPIQLLLAAAKLESHRRNGVLKSGYARTIVEPVSASTETRRACR